MSFVYLLIPETQVCLYEPFILLASHFAYVLLRAQGNALLHFERFGHEACSIVTNFQSDQNSAAATNQRIWRCLSQHQHGHDNRTVTITTAFIKIGTTADSPVGGSACRVELRWTLYKQVNSSMCSSFRGLRTEICSQSWPTYSFQTGRFTTGTEYNTGEKLQSPLMLLTGGILFLYYRLDPVSQHTFKQCQTKKSSCSVISLAPSTSCSIHM